MTTWSIPLSSMQACVKYHSGCLKRITVLRTASEMDFGQRPARDIADLVLRGMFAMADATAYMQYSRILLVPDHAKT